MLGEWEPNKIPDPRQCENDFLMTAGLSLEIQTIGNGQELEGNLRDG